jgi:galactokinase
MIDSAAVAAHFEERFGRGARLFSAPGRVNLIGEHTDYNDGFVLPIAIEPRTWVAAAPRTDRKIRVFSADLDDERTFSLELPWQRRGAWTDYVEGVARALVERSVPVTGADLWLASDVPAGAGLSSSAALELAVGLALSTLAGVTLPLETLALVGQRAENEYVGVRSGVMDQLASALGREGHALFIDCRSLAVTPVALPQADVSFVVADSGVRHSHAASGYNQRRKECHDALALLDAAGLSKASLRDVSVAELPRVESALPDVLARRVRHVVTENARTEAAVAALTAADFVRFGALMLESHASLRHDYEASAPELDQLVDAAAPLSGVLGARMTGGGFGGSAIVLVRDSDRDAVIQSVERNFAARFGHKPAFRAARASAGARRDALPSA